MKKVIFLFCLFVSGIAFAKDAQCLLSVDGQTYINGICDFTSQKGGSFEISSDKYFAQVLIEEKNIASGFWNEEAGATRAHGNLGELYRKGACWQNARAKVCAKALK